MLFFACDNSDLSFDANGEAEIVANDVKAGKKANEVSYGRQDVDFDTVAKTRKTNRQHGKASRELPVDKYTLKEYNSSEMFTETNEFMQAVPY